MTNVNDYPIEIKKADSDGESGFIATIPALGAIGDGETVEDAIRDVREVAADLIEIAMEDGAAVPRPTKKD